MSSGIQYCHFGELAWRDGLLAHSNAYIFSLLGVCPEEVNMMGYVKHFFCSNVDTC
jgi:hypothetical protein